MIVEAPSLTPRSRRRAKNLEMILDKAMDLVILSGWEGFSVHRLAREVIIRPEHFTAILILKTKYSVRWWCVF